MHTKCTYAHVNTNPQPHTSIHIHIHIHPPTYPPMHAQTHSYARTLGRTHTVKRHRQEEAQALIAARVGATAPAPPAATTEASRSSAGSCPTRAVTERAKAVRSRQPRTERAEHRPPSPTHHTGEADVPCGCRTFRRAPRKTDVMQRKKLSLSKLTKKNENHFQKKINTTRKYLKCKLQNNLWKNSH